MKDKAPNLFKSKDEFLKELLKIHERADDLSRNSFVSAQFKDKSFSERIEVARQLDKGEVTLPAELGEASEDVDALIRAATILDLLGMVNTSRDIRRYLHVAGQYKIMENYMMSHIVHDEAKNIISEKNSENASGPKNKKYEQVISILIATWNEYPNTSKNAMIKKVYEHFKGAVSEQSIARWIKEKGFGPKQQVRPGHDFKLVIPS